MRTNKPNAGSFTKGSEAAKKAGKKGGKASHGNFKNDPERASDAGRKGGIASGISRQPADEQEA